MTENVKERMMTIEKLFQAARCHHEFILSLATFEQDAIEAKSQLNKAVATNKVGTDQDIEGKKRDSSTSGNNRRTPVAFAAFSANERVCAIIQTTSQRGRELLNYLESEDDAGLKLSDDERAVYVQRIRHHLHSIDEGSNILAQFAEDQRRKLIIEWISDADHRLNSSFNLALSFEQAAACKQSHEGIISMVEVG
ncbi:hypothetical protein ACOME3_008331 [Neoechinorhynchus agilis]